MKLCRKIRLKKRKREDLGGEREERMTKGKKRSRPMESKSIEITTPGDSLTGKCALLNSEDGRKVELPYISENVLEMKNSTKAMKKPKLNEKQPPPQIHDASHHPLEEGSLSKSVETNNGYIEQVERSSFSNNAEVGVAMNVFHDGSLDANLNSHIAKENALQTGEGSRIGNEKNMSSENVETELIEDYDPTTSMQALPESSMQTNISYSDSISSEGKKLKTETEFTIHDDRVLQESSSSHILQEDIVKKNVDELIVQGSLEKASDLGQANALDGNSTSVAETMQNYSLEIMDDDLKRKKLSPNVHLPNLSVTNSSLKSRDGEENRLQKKRCLPSDSDRDAKNNDQTTSLLFTDDSIVRGVSVCHSNVVYSSKKRRKKSELSVFGEKESKESSHVDVLHEDLLENCASECHLVKKEFSECDAFERQNMEVSGNDCGKHESTLLSDCFRQNISNLDRDESATSMLVVETDAAVISFPGCKEPTLKENIKAENEDCCGITNAVVDCEPVEKNSESCSENCQKEACKIAENTVKKQHKLLDPSMAPEKLYMFFTRRKLLILDLNGLLVDMINYESCWRKPDARIGGRFVYKRPYCDDFLKFCFERFNVGIWSSRTRRNMEAVVDFLMGDHKYKMLFFWDQSQCTYTGFSTVENRDKPLFLKELQKIWDKEVQTLPWERGDYSPSNTLLLDDSPYKALRNPPYTGLFPLPYCFKDSSDNSLGPKGALRLYLEGLVKSDDVPSYVKANPFGQRPITSSNPSWAYYRKVIGVEK